MQAAWIPALVTATVITVVLYLARKQIAGLAAHGRDMIRHLLALVLMAGTLAGTVWTFSAGKLTLNGALERVTSVGGIALALEVGAIYCGWYIGQLDMRIMSARRRDQADELRQLSSSLYRWFYATVAISAIANMIFRVQQLGNIFLAAFVSAAPVVLIILFTIKLRPLPTDYAEIGRQATQRGLVVLVEQSQQVLLRNLTNMGKGEELTPAQLHQLGLAAALLRTYARPDEQQALDYAINQRTSETAGAGGVVDATSEAYLSTADIATMYDVSRRTAQLWIGETPGRKRTSGNAWAAPAGAIYAKHGLPTTTTPQLAAPQIKRHRTSRRTDIRTQDGANVGTGDAAPAQASAGDTQDTAGDTQDTAGEAQPTGEGVTSYGATSDTLAMSVQSA